MTDEDAERIYEEATEAALNAWIGSRIKCPYPECSEEAEVWTFAFRQTFARENH